MHVNNLYLSRLPDSSTSRNAAGPPAGDTAAAGRDFLSSLAASSKGSGSNGSTSSNGSASGGPDSSSAAPQAGEQFASRYGLRHNNDVADGGHHHHAPRPRPGLSQSSIGGGGSHSAG
jgi:hypothetical protein